MQALPPEEVHATDLKCIECYLPLKMCEFPTQRIYTQREVACHCPVCKSVVARIMTEHDVVVSLIH